MNPYQVLGIGENATQEQIRAAYLSLVKRYHPDKYHDGSLKELAGEKIKQVNEAYELLKKKPQGTLTAPPRGRTDRSSASARGYSGPHQAAFARTRALINQSNLNGARAILDAIPDRNAEWHYLSGIIHLRQGRQEKAREHIMRAYELDPSSTEYRNAHLSLINVGDPYGKKRSAVKRKRGLFGKWFSRS